MLLSLILIVSIVKRSVKKDRSARMDRSMFRWWSLDFRKHRNLALLLIIFMIWIIFWLEIHESQRKTHAFIHSAYYFPVSKSLDPNSISLILTIDRNYLRDIRKIQLIGSSSTETKASGVKISIEGDGEDGDFVTALVQSKEGFEGLEKLEIDQNGKVFEIPFKTILPAPSHSVVFCYSPQRISENWQDFLLQTRLSAHFWAHSHYYIEGITQPFYRLIRELADQKKVSIQPWIHYDRAGKGAVWTDCLMQYKERTEYVAFLDSDDLLMPSGVDSYYEEFMRLFEGHPLITSLRYSHVQMDVSYGSWHDYSIPPPVSRISLERSSELGKLVVRTDMFNSTGQRFSENANTRKNSRITKKVPFPVYRLNQMEPPAIPNSNQTTVTHGFQEINNHLEAVDNEWKILKNRAEIQKIGEKLPNRRYFSGVLKNSAPSQPDDLQCLISATVIQSIKTQSIIFYFASEQPSLVTETDCF